MIEVVFGAPESPVDVDDKRINGFAFFFEGRQTQIEKLVWVRAIGEPRVGMRRWQSQNVIRHGGHTNSNRWRVRSVTFVCGGGRSFRLATRSAELRWDRDSRRAERGPFR